MTNSAPAVSDRVRDRNRLFRALSHHRRRRVLRTLRRRGEVTVSDLAETVARIEHGRSAGEVPSQDVTAACLDLYHCHIPLLEEAGLVSRTGDGTVRLADRRVDVDACLDALTG